MDLSSASQVPAERVVRRARVCEPIYQNNPDRTREPTLSKGVRAMSGKGQPVTRMAVLNVRHGTKGYDAGCGCESCRDANADRARRYRHKHAVQFVCVWCGRTGSRDFMLNS